MDKMTKKKKTMEIAYILSKRFNVGGDIKQIDGFKTEQQ